MLTMNDASIEDIISDFEYLEDWEQRYQYLTELGEALDTMPAAEKTASTRVMGCMSKVWVKALPDPDNAGKVLFHGDCDTSIIKGLLALLIGLFNGKSPQQIAAMDIDALFDSLALAENLSPTRHVGVYGIVAKMNEQAQAFA